MSGFVDAAKKYAEKHGWKYTIFRLCVGSVVVLIHFFGVALEKSGEFIQEKTENFMDRI